MSADAKKNHGQLSIRNSVFMLCSVLSCSFYFRESPECLLPSVDFSLIKHLGCCILNGSVYKHKDLMAGVTFHIMLNFHPFLEK